MCLHLKLVYAKGQGRAHFEFDCKYLVNDDN